MEGRHYDEICMDDAASTPKDINWERIDKKWYDMVKEEVRMLTALPGPIFTNLNYEEEEKGGNEMTRHLYHVILFNTATEKIDFKGYLPAQSTEAALMAAAQTFGKYDADVHVHNVKSIMQYEKK